MGKSGAGLLDNAPVDGDHKHQSLAACRFPSQCPYLTSKSVLLDPAFSRHHRMREGDSDPHIAACH